LRSFAAAEHYATLHFHGLPPVAKLKSPRCGEPCEGFIGNYS